MVSPDREYDIDLVSEEKDAAYLAGKASAGAGTPASEGMRGKKIEFPEILLISDDSKVTVGQPTVTGATVSAEILSEVREPKTTVLKFHSKKRYQRTLGHRAKKTRIKILSINVKTKK